MAATLAGYLSNTDTTVHHAYNLGLHKKADAEWMNTLAATGKDWLIFTGDRRILKRHAERDAFRRAGLKGVILAPAYQKTTMCRRCGIVVAKWDDLIAFTATLKPPYFVELSINLNQSYKRLSI